MHKRPAFILQQILLGILGLRWPISSPTHIHISIQWD